MFSIEVIAKEMEATKPGRGMRNLARTIVSNVLCHAANEVKSHWNDSLKMGNQKIQAERSAEVLLSQARDFSSQIEIAKPEVPA